MNNDFRRRISSVWFHFGPLNTKHGLTDVPIFSLWNSLRPLNSLMPNSTISKSSCSKRRPSTKLPGRFLDEDPNMNRLQSFLSTKLNHQEKENVSEQCDERKKTVTLTIAMSWCLQMAWYHCFGLILCTVVFSNGTNLWAFAWCVPNIFALQQTVCFLHLLWSVILEPTRFSFLCASPVFCNAIVDRLSC